MATLGAILTWAVFGLVVGVIARALYPGRQSMGLIMTIVLGIAGSIVGGFLASVLTNDPGRPMLGGAGWILSILGAMLVVWVSLAMGGRRGG